MRCSKRTAFDVPSLATVVVVVSVAPRPGGSRRRPTTRPAPRRCRFRGTSATRRAPRVRPRARLASVRARLGRIAADRRPPGGSVAPPAPHAPRRVLRSSSVPRAASRSSSRSQRPRRRPRAPAPPRPRRRNPPTPPATPSRSHLETARDCQVPERPANRPVSALVAPPPARPRSPSPPRGRARLLLHRRLLLLPPPPSSTRATPPARRRTPACASAPSQVLVDSSTSRGRSPRASGALKAAATVRRLPVHAGVRRTPTTRCARYVEEDVESSRATGPGSSWCGGGRRTRFVGGGHGAALGHPTEQQHHSSVNNAPSTFDFEDSSLRAPRALFAGPADRRPRTPRWGWSPRGRSRPHAAGARGGGTRGHGALRRGGTVRGGKGRESADGRAAEPNGANGRRDHHHVLRANRWT